MINKIALSGKACSGKGTIIDIAKKTFFDGGSWGKYGFQFISDINFADPIKKIALELYPDLDYDFLWGNSELRDTVIEGSVNNDGNELKVRRLLTDIGKFGRQYNSNIFIDATLATAKKTLSAQPLDIVIICDCRFKNELKALKENGYYIIRVIRPDNPVSIDDISETDLDDVELSEFNEVLINDDLGKLEEKVFEMISKLIYS